MSNIVRIIKSLIELKWMYSYLVSEQVDIVGGRTRFVNLKHKLLLLYREQQFKQIEKSILASLKRHDYDKFCIDVIENASFLLALKKSYLVELSILLTDSAEEKVRLLSKLQLVKNNIWSDDIGGNVIQSVHEKFTCFKDVEMALEGSNIDPYTTLFLKSRFNRNDKSLYMSYSFKKLDFGQKLSIRFANGDYKYILKALSGYRWICSRRIFNIYFSSNLQLSHFGTLDRLHGFHKSILFPHLRLTHKNRLELSFGRGNFKNALEVMRDRPIRNQLKKVLPHAYDYGRTRNRKQNTLILSTWGPGDEIRFSTFFYQLSEIFPNLSITCDYRLLTIFESLFENISFIPTKRTRTVNRLNYRDFSRIPIQLTNLMDNECFDKISEYESVLLITDIMHQLEPENIKRTTFFSAENTKSVSVSDFISRIRCGEKPLIGINWRSMIRGPLRDMHYFDLEELVPLFSELDAVYVSLQYDDCEKEINKIKQYYGIEIHVPPIDQLNDFASVCELISQLDLAICAGTTVLELSGLTNTRTIALTNNIVQKYRIDCNNADVWFSNVEYIDGCMNLGKYNFIEALKNKIRESFFYD